MRASAKTHPVLWAAIATMALGLLFESVQAVTGLGGSGLRTLGDKYAYTAVELIAVAVCAARVRARRADRAAWTLITLALVAWTAGDLTWTLWLDSLGNPPFPSLADGFYLLMYPAMYAGLMLLIRARLANAGASQWMDGGVIGLAIAAVAAALVFDTVTTSVHGRLIDELVNAAYPVGDLVLLAFVALAFSLSGWRPGRSWALLGAGMTLTAAADMISTYQSATGAYTAGTLLDAAWPLSMALLALAAWAPETRHRADPVPAPHTILLTLCAATAALALLVLAAFEHLTPVAVGLAAGALTLASLRAAATYLENVRMLRRSAHEALTDPLSGLGNRRRLMDDLHRVFDHPNGAAATTLVFFDLDGFKRYNDSFGHAAGDALLARIGTALRATVADNGASYRLGGDEFCVLLDGRFGPQDRIVAAAASALVERGSAFNVTASLGLAVIPEDAVSASAALQLADERMYQDKARRSGAGRAQARDVLMALLSERMPGLHHHVTGVGALVTRIATSFELEGEQLDELLRAAELHDIGKLAIPDEILSKPGPLTESEWRFMRQHSVIGERILSAAPALRPVARLVRASHERWDGTGYPDALAGVKIPLGARIVAVCDAYDAMVSDRCYQRARTPEQAIRELRRHAGTQFDPEVVRALCTALEAAPAALEPAAPEGLHAHVE